MRRLVAVFTGWLIAVAVAAAQAPSSRIWDGVFTVEQAEHGKELFSTLCVRCHGADLAGNTAPALKGDRFMTSWGGGSVSRLFEKIRDTMPPNFGSTLDDREKLSIVTYILQTNGYPAGARELTTGSELASIQILRKGEQASVQNFSLVQTVGCLTAGPDDSWLLRRSAEPIITTDDAPTKEALTGAAAKPLGDGSFVLLSARKFNPAEHRGEKVEARGLIYRDASQSLMTVTSLTAVGACGN